MNQTSTSPTSTGPASSLPVQVQPAGDASARYSGALQSPATAQGQLAARSAKSLQPEPVAMRPAVDIFEDEGGVTLLADMPGVSREQLQVRVDGETLWIEGTATVVQAGNIELLHGELLTPHYRRSFTLSRDLDASHIEARLQHGVLRLRIPKSESAKPRRITVQAG